MHYFPDYLEILKSEKISDYIKKACLFNGEDAFNFKYPSNIKLTDLNMEKALRLADIYTNFEMIEGSSIESKTSLVPVPYKFQHGNISKLSMIDIGLLGTKGTKLGKHPPYIYSNWQKNEIKNEPWVRKTISPGWYLFVRGGIVDFCNLSWNSQIDLFSEHSLFSSLKSILGSYEVDAFIARAEIAYVVGCLDSLCCNGTHCFPLRQSFVRTNSFFNDGTQIGILGSPYGFDVDGFWAGTGAAPNSSLCFCHLIQSY